MQPHAQHNTSLQPDLRLLLLFLLTAAVILFRVYADSTGYLSPDSGYYLKLAQSLLEGQGFYILGPVNDAEYRFFATWPVGYPVLIYLAAAGTGLPVFWASKIVNLLFMLLGFLLIRAFNRKHAYVVASVYGSYTLLEIYSFTWSEAPFAFGMLLLAFLVHRHLQNTASEGTIFLLFLTCLFLFLIRYVGAFAVSVPALLAAHAFLKKNYAAAWKLAAAAVVLVLLMGLYLGMNYYLSGRITGVDRQYGQTETAGEFMLMLLQGLLNEAFIIRKHFFSRSPDALFVATTALQCLAIGAIMYFFSRSNNRMWHLKQHTLSLTCFGLGLLYLAAIIVLRLVSQFDALDYRLLSPCSFLALVGITNYLTLQPVVNRSAATIRWIVVVFFLLSLFINLPKQYLLQKLSQLL